MRIIFKDGKWMAVGKITIAGQEHEVEHEVTPDAGVNVMTADQLKEGFVPKASITKRIDRAKTAARTELLQDEQFKAEALTAWKVTPAPEGGNTTDIAERLKSERVKWETEHLKPIQEAKTALEAKVGTLQRSKLHSQILAAASEAGVADDLLKPIGPKKLPMILNMVESYFEMDDKTENFFVKGDGDDFEFSKNPQGGQIYMGVGEFLSDWARQNPLLAPAAKQSGPDARNPNGPQGPVDKRAQIQKLEAEGKLHEANTLKAELLQETRQ